MKAYNYNMGACVGVTDRYPTCVGVEIEWEQYHPLEGHQMEYWNITHDGSLRDSGVEFVSTPLTPDSVRYAFAEMMGHHGTSFTVASTDRCGVHVHVNVLGLTYGQFLSLCVLYAGAEPGFMMVAGEQRNDNVFCIPWYHTPDQLHSLADHHALARRSPYLMPRLRSNAPRDFGRPNWNKYQALNLLPMFDQGTIEFRMAPTWELPRIEVWTNTVLGLRDLAEQFPVPEEAAEFLLVEGAEGVWERIGLAVMGRPPYLDEALDVALTLAGEEPMDWRDLSWEVPESPVFIPPGERRKVRPLPAQVGPWARANLDIAALRMREEMEMREVDEYPEDEEYHEDEDEEDY